MNWDRDAALAGPDDLRWLSAELDSAAWESSTAIAPAAHAQAIPRPSDGLWPLIVLGAGFGTLAYFLVG